MTNPLLPIIEELASAQDDAARARWLLACPLNVLLTYQSTIRNRLQAAFFHAGVAYLDAELAVLRSVRKSGIVTKDNPLRVPMLGIAGYRAFEAPEI